MPVPYVAECQESMNAVSTNKAAIVAAINKIKGLADDATWSGDPANSWMTDLNGHVADALAELGGTLDEQKQVCMAHAHKMQAASAKTASAPS